MVGTAVPRLPATYRVARDAFCDAARATGARLASVTHPARGPEGEPLAVDVARLGRPDAPARLVVISGTHGVEGHAGSMCQHALLGDGDLLAAIGGDVGLVLVHALNPYGFAWCRRVNEDNVDLNRNCVDFTAGVPENPAYDELADALVPARWDDPAVRAAADEVLVAYAARHGFGALQAAVSRGQYRHPTGVFYGGAGPVWSQRVLARIAEGELARAERVAVLDLHTGLGAWGEAELIASHPDPAARARLANWYGAFTVPAEGTSVSADVSGDILDGLDRWLPPGMEVTSVAIEWGTVDIVQVSNALRADAWLHAYGDLDSPAAEAIKAELRVAFAPAEAEWAGVVADRFRQVVSQALRGLMR